jgi:hypothetical protein
VSSPHAASKNILRWAREEPNELIGVFFSTLADADKVWADLHIALAGARLPVPAASSPLTPHPRFRCCLCCYYCCCCDCFCDKERYLDYYRHLKQVRDIEEDIFKYKRNREAAEKRVSKAEADLERLRKKSDAGKLGAAEIELTHARALLHAAECEYAGKLEEIEVHKCTAVRKGIQQLCDAYMQIGDSLSQLARTMRETSSQLPDSPDDLRMPDKLKGVRTCPCPSRHFDRHCSLPAIHRRPLSCRGRNQSPSSP